MSRLRVIVNPIPIAPASKMRKRTTEMGMREVVTQVQNPEMRTTCESKLNSVKENA